MALSPPCTCSLTHWQHARCDLADLIQLVVVQEGRPTGAKRYALVVEEPFDAADNCARTFGTLVSSCLQQGAGGMWLRGVLQAPRFLQDVLLASMSALHGPACLDLHCRRTRHGPCTT